jgi:hypothetical protein
VLTLLCSNPTFIIFLHFLPSCSSGEFSVAIDSCDIQNQSKQEHEEHPSLVMDAPVDDQRAVCRSA